MELDIIYNEDCLEGMKRFPDKSIDIVITDPPYGLNIAKSGCLSIKGSSSKQNKFGVSSWDENRPNKEYFEQIFRISKNQIIWGGNYFTDYLQPSKCWLIWDKKSGLVAKTFADCELAWTSYDYPMRIIRNRWHGFIRNNQELRLQHPTQKPIAVMTWCIRRFSQIGQIVLDPFIGSGTIALACKQLGRHYIGFEINPEYYEIAKKRLAEVQLELIK